MRNINTLFSHSSGPGAVYIKIAPGHVTLNLYFCIKWDLPVTKGITVRPGHEMSTPYFPALVGPERFS
jgi:hypothetical protein